mmetsp:Transcript_48483/g.83278  ORF Transcript_48483/g.83278 Transcript_48483/m.83278 type:complete len:87 (+) Transcript_48483:44-304(+)
MTNNSCNDATPKQKEAAELEGTKKAGQYTVAGAIFGGHHVQAPMTLKILFFHKYVGLDLYYFGLPLCCWLEDHMAQQSGILLPLPV